MSTTATPVRGEKQLRPERGRDLSIDYLRTTLTLMVLAHHSCLAYTSWAYFDRELAAQAALRVLRLKTIL